MRARFSPSPWLSTRTQGDLSRRVFDPPLPLCPCPLGWGHYLACPVHDVHSGVYSPPALRLTLSPDAPGGGPQCPVGNVRWTQFGTVYGALRYLPDGPLSPDLCVWPSWASDSTDAVWAALAHLLPGRREAQPLSDSQSLSTDDCE
jgi:hypothetical protein